MYKKVQEVDFFTILLVFEKINIVMLIFFYGAFDIRAFDAIENSDEHYRKNR
uniref:Uncharacterized protein n=1 Tax=Candidatus Kentrum sp. FW TaxID=2126338 RepID=A0A450SZ84_9GAMM|nr:MAG: hypothetical protein BECKFW1821B_GA0114236_104819 [Candidatus Kentron sp. FW]